MKIISIIMIGIIIGTTISIAEQKETLCSAVDGDQVDLAKQLIAHGVKHKELNQALKKAARWSTFEMVKTLVEAGANNLTGALFEAAEDHKPDRFPIVKYLVEHGAEINKKDNDGATPLYLTIYDGRNETSNWLLDMGADPKVWSSEVSTKAICRAALKGNEKVVRKLIGKGVSVNVKNSEGYTPLHNAALMGKPEIAKVLIEAGSYVDTQDNTGNTPLHLTAHYLPFIISKQADVAKLLLEAGANPFIKTKHGETALDIFINGKEEWSDTPQALWGGKEITPEQKQYLKKWQKSMPKILKRGMRKYAKKAKHSSIQSQRPDSGFPQKKLVSDKNKSNIPATTVPDSTNSLSLKMILMIAAIICIAGITALIIKKHKK